jgi:alkylation response protein AidB-like acyl-CoA dehydrogenase
VSVSASPPPHVAEILLRLDRFVDEQVVPVEAELARRQAERPPSTTPDLDPDGSLTAVVREARAEVRRRSAAAGFYTLHLPRELGGGGLGRADMLFVEEAVYAMGLGLRPSILAWTEGPSPLARHFSADQRERFLAPLMEGTATAAFANTEPDAGSDVLGVRTRAVRDGDGWVISGTKLWITNARFCDHAMVTAVTEPGAGPRSLTLFLVEADRPGFVRGPTRPTLIEDGVTAELTLDSVNVPDENRVGEIGQGLALALTGINWRRLCRGGMCSGWMRLLIERAARRMRERRAYGGALADLQVLRHMLADMHADWYSARSTSLLAQDELDRLGAFDIPLSSDAIRLVSVVKLVNDQAFMRVSDRALQIHGAAGLAKGTLEERLFRLARNLRIPAGTDEIQRNQIARQLLRDPSP